MLKVSLRIGSAALESLPEIGRPNERECSDAFPFQMVFDATIPSLLFNFQEFLRESSDEPGILDGEHHSCYFSTFEYEVQWL